MIRAIVCPPDVPENYQEIIIVFAEHDSKHGKSGTMMHFGATLLEQLRKMPLATRYRLIKQICSGMEESLLQSSMLQSSSNPNDVRVTAIDCH
jgi:hypothetical protein